MNYIPEESKIIYQSKGPRKNEKIFDSLEWIVPPGPSFLGSYLPRQSRLRRKGRLCLDTQDRGTYSSASKKGRLITYLAKEKGRRSIEGNALAMKSPFEMAFPKQPEDSLERSGK